MKAANSYASLLRGVSQQVPQDRAEGQHTEQINMLSDPVDGLTRRHGSLWRGEKHRTTLAVAQYATYKADVANWVSYDFDNAGKEYAVLYRTTARPVSANPIPLFIVYNKTDNVFLDYVSSGGAALLAVEAAGIAALTSVGKYLFFTGVGQNITGTTSQTWNDSANFKKAVVWVRSGAYSRTFKVTVRLQSGVSHTVSYTTPASSYQGVLTTADIPYAASDYAKQVNETFVLGLGQTGSAAPGERTIYFPGPEYKTLHCAHDVKKANQMLDHNQLWSLFENERWQALEKRFQS